jgi:hypothetical protein
VNEHFVQVKSLDGELKLSQKNKGFGYSITTKEIVFQRPYLSYHVYLADVVSLIPLTTPPRNMTFDVDHHTKITTNFGGQYYKLLTTQAKVYTSKGWSERGETEFYVALSESFLQYFKKYSKLTLIDSLLSQ